MTWLKVENIHTYIDQFHILQGVSLDVRQGEVTVLLGRNGAGKTTTLRSVIGLNPIRKGRIHFQDQSIHAWLPHQIARSGIGYVPEDQGIFQDLTVADHMKIAAKDQSPDTKEREQWILDLFPDLKTFWRKRGGHLSGGQKQMLSIARAYVNQNDLLLIDEPSKGLAPIVVEKVMASLLQMKEKTTVVLVEQNFIMAKEIGDRYYIIDEGKTVHHGDMQQLSENDELKKQYLGIA